MSKTFDFYRSTSPRLHVAQDHEHQYTRYLQRIDNIVSKKPKLDLSNSFYCNFLNKCKQMNRMHKSQQNLTHITYQNKKLLQKIVQTKTRKFQIGPQPVYIDSNQRKIRQQEQIDEENRRMAIRVINASSKIYIKHKSTFSNVADQNSKPKEFSFYNSRIKQNRLPKLIQKI